MLEQFLYGMATLLLVVTPSVLVSQVLCGCLKFRSTLHHDHDIAV